ncbi:hypothetical protein QSV04_10700, partial [Bifidobacterium longum]|uniref:hypothetical protein n=1 Tax=Bifidobacterium longum TaxID=216816 RepID=UPI0025705A25
MSIRTLISQGLIETDAAATSVNVTVAFAFDSTYLDLFKVAVSSLALSGNFIDAQLAVYTNDAEVFDDPIVRRCADKKVLLSGSRKQVLESLASSSVKRPDRKDWNRGTFLKWQVFEPQDTPVLVFLDVDMIFLRHFEKELLDAADRPLACCPQIIKKQFFAPDTSEIAYGHARALLNHALQGIYQGRLQSNVNSGVMAVSGELLGDA